MAPGSHGALSSLARAHLGLRHWLDGKRVLASRIDRTGWLLVLVLPTAG